MEHALKLANGNTEKAKAVYILRVYKGERPSCI